MQESTSVLREIASKYIDSGKPVIPVFGKAPRMQNWQKYCDSIPLDEEFEAFNFTGATGIGLCLGESSGVCCIDIDTLDGDLYGKIESVIQHSPCSKVGKKGITFFYRLPKNIPAQKIQTIKLDGGEVEFFFGGKQTVIPPSVHPETNEQYRWIGEALSYDYDIENLPIFDLSNIDAIKALSQGKSATSAVSPILGRNNFLKREVAMLLSQRRPLLESISILVEKDRDHHGANAFFSDPKENRTSDAYINALRFFTSNLYSINSRKEVGANLDSPIDLCHTVASSQELIFKEIIPYGSVVSIEQFNDEWIPECMRSWIQTFSLATSQPTDALFMALLCSLSSLTGAKVSIMPTHNDRSWRELSNIYIMIIAASGGGKTLIEKLATIPLVDIEKAYDELYEKDSKKQKAEKRFNQARIKALESQYNKAVAAGDQDEAIKLSDEIQRLEALVEPVKKKQFRSSNATPEKLIEIIESNPTGHFHSADELGVLLKQYDKKGYELLKAIHLNLYNNGRFTYETKASGSYTLENCSLSILCSGQVSVYNEYVRSLTSEGAQDDGHLQRFIPVVNLEKEAKFDPNIKNDLSVPKEVQYIFNKAYSLSSGITVETTEAGNKEMVRIKTESIKNWHSYQAINENMLAGVESKKRGHIAKLSFLLSFIKNNGKMAPIDAQEIIHAEKIVNNLYYRLEYCYKNKKDKMPEMRGEFKALIEAGIVCNGVNIRDVIRSSGKFTQNKEAFNTMLEEMEATNRIIIVKEITGGKRIYLNPSFVSSDGL